MNTVKETTLEEVYGMSYEKYKKVEDKHFEKLNKKFKEFEKLHINDMTLINKIQKKKQYLIKKYNDKAITKMIEDDTELLIKNILSRKFDSFQIFRRYFEYTEHIQDALKDYNLIG